MTATPHIDAATPLGSGAIPRSGTTSPRRGARRSTGRTVTRTAPSRTRPADTRPPGRDPVQLASVLARAWVEVRAGSRPLHQLAPLVSPAARRRLAAQLPPRGPAASRDPIRVRPVRPFAPAPGALEVTVLVEQQQRTSAIAVRMERHRGAWRAVELTAPEAGLAALPTSSLPVGHRFPDAFDEVLAEHGEDLPPQGQQALG